jgi:hypothetical protein
MTQSAQLNGLKGTKNGSKLDPYKTQLEMWMQQNIFNYIVRWMNILKEYVHPYRPRRFAPAVRCYETYCNKYLPMN